jgi:hypothetical protein
MSCRDLLCGSGRCQRNNADWLPMMRRLAMRPDVSGQTRRGPCIAAEAR